MQSNSAIIKSMIEEHQAIRAHLELLRRSLEGGFYSIPKKPCTLADSLKNIQLAMSYLEDGIKNHYTHEEMVMPPLLGEPLMHAIAAEHKEVQHRLDRAKALVADASLKLMSQEEFITKASEIKRVIDDICELIETHSLKEDTMLELLKRAV